MKLKSFVTQARAAVAINKQNRKAADARALSLFIMGAMVAAVMVPGIAAAGPWDGVGQSVLAIFTGGLARTIAIISVIACGVAAMFGKLSWDWAIKIVIGIVLIFGATAIVDYFISASA
jgi:type IV secretory pathway VirB2 component (pilin)